MTMRINHAGVFREVGRDGELAAIVRTAMTETARLYNFDIERAEFRQTFFGEPGSASIESPFETMEEGWWQRARGQYSRTLDQYWLAEHLRGRIPEGNATVLVTDQEITPPREWRYVIWDSPLPRVTVASIAPLDPAYWGSRPEDRLAILKRRTRAMLIATTGAHLGLSRCDNSRCFLFSNVDSVTTLDEMVAIGEEHRLAALADVGFTETSIREADDPRKLPFSSSEMA